MDEYFFKMITFFFPLSDFVLAAIFAFWFKMRPNGVLIGMAIVNNLIVLIFFVKIFWHIDWNASQEVHEEDIPLVELLENE